MVKKKRHCVKFDKEKCKGSIGEGNECRLCQLHCKPQALQLSKDINSRSFHYMEHTDPEKCTGCGNCYLMCPHGGIVSIDIVDEDEIEQKIESRPAA